MTLAMFFLPFLVPATVIVFFLTLAVQNATGHVDWSCSKPYHRTSPYLIDHCTHALDGAAAEMMKFLPKTMNSKQETNIVVARPEPLHPSNMIVYQHLPGIATYGVNYVSREDPVVIAVNAPEVLIRNGDIGAQITKTIRKQQRNLVSEFIRPSSVFQYDFRIRRAFICVGFRIQTNSTLRRSSSEDFAVVSSWVTRAIPAFVASGTAVYNLNRVPGRAHAMERLKQRLDENYGMSIGKLRLNEILYLGAAGPPVEPSEFLKSPAALDLVFHFGLEKFHRGLRFFCNGDEIFTRPNILDTCVTHDTPKVFLQHRIRMLIQCGNLYPPGTTVFVYHLKNPSTNSAREVYSTAADAYYCQRGSWRSSHLLVENTRTTNQEWNKCKHMWYNLLAERPTYFVHSDV